MGLIACSRAAALVLLLAEARMPGANYVETVEVNTFGNPARTALIYRDAQDQIIDWRWFEPQREPQRVGPQRLLAVWREGDKLFTVVCRRVVSTRTLHDQELAERARLPDEQRRKLR